MGGGDYTATSSPESAPLPRSRLPESFPSAARAGQQNVAPSAASREALSPGSEVAIRLCTQPSDRSGSAPLILESENYRIAGALTWTIAVQG